MPLFACASEPPIWTRGDADFVWIGPPGSPVLSGVTNPTKFKIHQRVAHEVNGTCYGYGTVVGYDVDGYRVCFEAETTYTSVLQESELRPVGITQNEAFQKL